MTMPIYQEYAPFYDGSGQIRFAVLMSQYLEELLELHPVAGRRALDIACGTGTLALMLADTGWDVVGLDSAEAMLVQARAKAENIDAPGNVRFVQGDMRDLEPRTKNQEPGNDHSVSSSQFSVLGSQFNLVICVYDSLNYLLDEHELAACFAAASGVLAAGGLLVVDMNTRYFLEHDWGTCDVLEQPDFIQVTQSYFEPATACSTMVLTGFAGDDEQGYSRFDETHIERAYPAETVAELLTAAGLQLEASYDCFTFQPVEERTQRIAWVARKPGLRTEDSSLVTRHSGLVTQDSSLVTQDSSLIRGAHR